MFAKNGVFRPRYGLKNSLLPLPVNFSRLNRLKWSKILASIATVIIIIVLFNPIPTFLRIFKGRTHPSYPAAHPLTSTKIIESSSKNIFPPIEHALTLKSLDIHELFNIYQVRDASAPDIEKTIIESLNMKDNPNPAAQKAKEEEENKASEKAKVINTFKNHDKVVYRPKSKLGYPKVVLVTSVDFEKYSQQTLISLVQNRVDYAHAQNYGVYVRWHQEFLPTLSSLGYLQTQEKAKWVRLYCMRAAMLAFPDAEWFWYLDQDALVMKKSIDLLQYVLDPDSLDPIMMRETPIVPPDGTIKTYKSSKASTVRLIATQSTQKLETYSFIVRNDDIGRAIVNTWGDPLYLNYPNFHYGLDSALTHILQWHPFILSNTAIIPARTIGARFDDKAKDERLSYFKDDFVAQWADCDNPVSCEASFREVYNEYQHK